MTNPYELIAQQEEMDYGPERVALAEEAVRLADLSGDEEAGYDTRMALIDTVNMSGQSEKMFAPFAWCQDFAARHPDYASDYMLAWYHKWLLGAAHQLPQIPLRRIHELHASYAQYARRLGAGASSIPYLQMELAMHVGDHAAAARAYNVWQFAKGDMLSDCPACEAQTGAEYHLFMGDDAATIKQGQHILDKGLTCGHIPHLTYGTLLLPLLRSGKSELAAQYAAQGREMVAGDRDFLSTQAEHLEYLALTDPGAGVAWYERHLSWAEATREMRSKLDFHAAAALLFTRVEGETVRLTLPELVEGHAAGGIYPVAERLNYHREEALRLAALFDTRAGNDFATQQAERTFNAS
ncbi:hypothetical protein ACFP81_14065 [Deinococcus lacus]|uniref:Uncharacterized protein n=1 Tax=Deinococcus lacus TaxID=392561 RepID=A0ABW1YHS3_9DEIO